MSAPTAKANATKSRIAKMRLENPAGEREGRPDLLGGPGGSRTPMPTDFLGGPPSRFDPAWASGASSHSANSYGMPDSNFTIRKEPNCLVQPERDFDRHDRRDRLPARSDRRLELPALYGFDRFLFQPEARALHDGDVHRAPIGRNRDLQHDRALILCLARFVRILRNRAVQAHRNANAIHARAKCAAAGAAALTRTQTAARAAADTRSVAVAQRVGKGIRQRVTQAIRPVHFQIRRAEQRRIHSQLRI